MKANAGSGSSCGTLLDLVLIHNSTWTTGVIQINN